MAGNAPVQLLPIGYYTKILTSQYATSPLFQQWLQEVLRLADDISQCLASIPSAFDLNFAVGAQLDILGQIIGPTRVVPFQPSSGVSPVLDDNTYRLLLRATIANNQWDGKQGSLYEIWTNLFPGGHITIIDNQNMTATIVMTGSFSSIIQDLISHDLIVPRPEAVQYNYVFGGIPFFGFSTANTAYLAGFGVGKWS
jgi:hypothetical protein